MAKQEARRAIESEDWYVSRRQINEETNISTINGRNLSIWQKMSIIPTESQLISWTSPWNEKELKRYFFNVQLPFGFSEECQ